MSCLWLKRSRRLFAHTVRQLWNQKMLAAQTLLSPRLTFISTGTVRHMWLKVMHQPYAAKMLGMCTLHSWAPTSSWLTYRWYVLASMHVYVHTVLHFYSQHSWYYVYMHVHAGVDGRTSSKPCLHNKTDQHNTGENCVHFQCCPN